ncbi:Thioredoxin/protein disulfide isomerase [Phaffia rhodozyma]|uniref:protein disulfide-isomerase n=1 Tax=Phaffia rhodozyma TaxID=264483 RepID=A0A0F7SW28_PHARH|nr:Thioredoxin/protein disulfide isomerase [Phaffia rhodozyma]
MRLLSLLLFPAVVLASNVLVLNDDNFDQHIGQAKGALVEFYAPWCGHCKNLAPTYEQLADTYSGKDVLIAKIDADGEGKKSGSRFGVKGYPTIKWFPAGSLKPVDYNSGRDLDSLVAFVSDKTGIKSKVKAPPPPATLELTVSNFDKFALDESKGTLVAFTAPWCGHCKSLKPVLEKVAADFKNEPDCIVAQMNADEQTNKVVSNRYGVKSYPTIKYFPSGVSKSIDFQPESYEKARTEEAFVEFLNKACGTSRVAGGGLSDVAGLIGDLDSIVGSVFNPTLATSLTALIASAESLAPSFLRAKDQESVKYYLRVLKKLDVLGENGRTWISNEKARLAKLASSSALNPIKKDELQIKSNILTSFLTQRAASIVDAAGDLFEDAKAQAQKGVDKAGEVVEDVKERIREEL